MKSILISLAIFIAAQANASSSKPQVTTFADDILPSSNNSINIGNSSGHSFASITANQGFFGTNITLPSMYNSGSTRSIQFNSTDPTNYPGFYLTSSDGDIVFLLTNHHALVTQSHIKTSTNSVLGGASRPSSAATANAGSSGSCTLSLDSDNAGQITINTAGTGRAGGDVCDMTFSYAYGSAPICNLTPVNATAAANANQVYVTHSTTALSINFVNAGGASDTFVYNYFCMETD